MKNKAVDLKSVNEKGDSRNLRIVLLEDSPYDAELIQFELRGAGLRFTATVTKTEEAYLKALDSCPDLILCDYDLPRYNGILALGEAKKRCPEVPFILVTGAVTEDRAIEVLTGGAKDYVLKKRLNRLVPAVQRALAETEEHRARTRAETELREAHRELEEKVKIATREAQRSEEKFSKAFYLNIAAMVISRLRDARILEVNDKWCELMGFSREEAVGKTTFELQSWKSNEDRNRAVNEIRRTGTVNLEYTFKRKDGTERTVLMLSQLGVLDDEETVFTSLIDITERKRAEEKLRIALNAGRMGVWVSDLEKGIVQTDHLHREIWDLDEDQEFVPIGVVWSRIHPDDLDKLNRFKGGLERTGPQDIEFRVIHRNGEARWLGAFAQPVFGPEGHLKSIIGVNFDITERKKVEEALRESEERYRLNFENSLSGILITDNKGTILDANPAAEKILGAKLEEIKKFGKYGLVDRSDPRFKKARKERTRTGAYFGEVTLKRAGGASFPAEISSAVFRNRKGQELISIIFQDISWRKQAEKVLMESAQQFREMADAMPQLVWIGTPEGQIDYFNSRYAAFSGVKKDPSGYWEWLPAVHPDDVPATLEAWRRGVDSQRDNQVEHRLKGTDGRYRWYLSRGVVVRNKEGKMIRWIGTTTDIHELKLAEQILKESTRELEEANKELDSFSYSVSHDLRAPLRAIEGFSRMLLKNEQELDTDMNRKIHVIRENAAKMERLISDLLFFSRSGRKQITTNKIDLYRLAKEVWEEQISENPDRKMAFKRGEIPEAIGDQALMRQVLTNLLSNAVKFTRMKRDAVIEMGGKSNRKENIYWVKDNGSGFDMKYADKLFGVFQRLHPESEYEGTGVGLAIVQRIIHRHGGRVWAEGKVGKGATFYFSLPSAGK